MEVNEVLSLGSGTRFQSGEEVEVRRSLKEACASFNALYHACRRLRGPGPDETKAKDEKPG